MTEEEQTKMVMKLTLCLTRGISALQDIEKEADGKNDFIYKTAKNALNYIGETAGGA